MKKILLGVYDYTVILTYLSFAIAVFGIFEACNGQTMTAIICLMLSGVCDLFDGKVARTKKNRTQDEKRFGIQIDSLCDLVCFGVLPGFIGYSTGLNNRLCVLVYILYALSALIRLAYFNVTEEERQDATKEKRKYYTGVPVTSAAIVFPIVCALESVNRNVFYFAMISVYILYSYFFLCKIKVEKPGKKGAIILIAVGFIEFGIYLLMKYFVS